MNRPTDAGRDDAPAPHDAPDPSPRLPARGDADAGAARTPWARVVLECTAACAAALLLRAALQPVLQSGFSYIGLYLAAIVVLLRHGLAPTVAMLAVGVFLTELWAPGWLQSPEAWAASRGQRWTTLAVALALLLPLVEALRRTRLRAAQARAAEQAQAAQRRTREQEAAQADRRLATLVQQANDAIMSCSVDGRLATWNPAAERLFGYRADEVIGQPMSLLAHPDEAPGQRELVEQVLGGRTVQCDAVRRHKDGRPLHVHLSVAPLLDERQRVVGMSAVAQDIGERRRAEEALRTSEATLRAFYDHAPVCMGVVELVGEHDIRHVYDNRVTCELFGLPPGGTAGRLSSAMGASEERRTRWVRHYRASVAHGPQRFDYTLGEGAQQRWMSATVCPVGAGPDGTRRFCYVSEDITERKQAEQRLREADRQKDEFLAILAHELRNPLSPLVTSVQLLRRLGHDAMARERSLAMMDRQLSHMVRMVNDLLDVGRITQQRLALSRAPVLLAVIVDDAVETSRPLIEQQGHRLQREVDGRLVVHGDATRLAQVLSNLLNNAAKYTPPGGEIRLQARRSQDGSATAEITVSDSGVGIPADQLERVFELFAQVPGSGERAMGGLGIGLSIARQLVRLHGGQLRAFSDGDGRGSRFVVTLPLAEAAQPAGRPASTAAALPLRVLVADDNRDAAQSLAELLQLDGHQVQVVHDGAAAVQAALAWRPQAALLDIGMPVMDGLQAARRLRESAPIEGRPLLVAVSGWGQAADQARAQEAGFDHHLTKPVRLEDLRRVLATAAAQDAAPQATPTVP